MCERMTQTTDPAEVARIFEAGSTLDEDAERAGPRYNVAPTQPLTVVTQPRTNCSSVVHHFDLPIRSQRGSSLSPGGWAGRSRC